MKSHTTVRSWGALALGLFFASVTARTILDDVWNGAPFTVAHLNAFAALVAAIAAGHKVIPTALERRFVLALGFLVLSIASTTYIVVSGGARNAEMSGTKNVEIAKRNQARTSAEAVMLKAQADLAKAKEDYREKKDVAARECASGKKLKCEGKMASAEIAERDQKTAEDAEKAARGQLLLLGPVEQEYAGYKHAAKTAEALGIGTAIATELKLELGMPFATVLIGEFATLLFVGLALGHKRVETPASVKRPEADQEPDTGPSPSALVIPFRPKSPDGKATKDEALEDLLVAIENREDLPSQETLVERWNRPKQTVSDWMASWRSMGIIPEAVKVGRCKAILAAA